MASFKISEILNATKGKLLQGDRGATVRGVSTNSQAVKKGELFIALVGEKHDAHIFIPQAIKNGAVAIMVTREVEINSLTVAVIKVIDTTKGLGDLAHFHRRRFNLPIIAITGSAGKTTTKEMIAAVLSKKYKVLKNIGTENNQFGVPLTILRMKASDKVAVIEVGTNRPGDIPWLASIVEPTIAILTNIGESHLELLKTKAGIFKEKFALIKALKNKGIAIVNGDDPLLAKVSQKTEHKVLTYGLGQKINLKAEKIVVKKNKIYFNASLAGKFTLAGTAKANVYNALAAIACGQLLKVEPQKIKNALSKFSFKSGRQAYNKLGKLVLIDDTYNANPVSFRSALAAINAQECHSRRILICADMLELGEQSQRLHQQIGVRAAEVGIDCIFSYGKFAKYIGLAAKKNKRHIEIFHSTSGQAIEEKIKNFLKAGDVVLVKGSRGMRTERFVEYIKKNYKER